MKVPAQQSTIWKFGLGLQNLNVIEMPPGAQLLDVQLQEGMLCLWAKVQPSEQTVARYIWMAGTGHVAPPGEYIATVQVGPYVWHFFDGGTP